MTALFAFAILSQQPFITKPDQFLLYTKSAVSSGIQARVEDLFLRKEESAYLFDMAQDRGGLRSIKVAMIPAPPGWEDTAPFWVVFHARQDIESHHDAVYPILRTTNGLKIGKELPEWAGIESRILDMSSDVHVYPNENRATINNWTTLDGKKTTRAPIFRLNDFYKLKSAKIGGTKSDVVVADETIPTPKEGDMVRAGGLLIPWKAQPGSEFFFQYEGVVNSQDEDKINPKQVYLTAYWTPSTGRLPHKSTLRIIGPKTFVLKGEGPQIKADFPPAEGKQTISGDEHSFTYRCEVPISYPKVIGGLYTLAAQATINGREFRSYQLEPSEPQRGQKELQLMADAIQFYEKTLGPFPFDHYYCFDATGYYGIESYSHTLLAKGITLRFISHEIGHTYFGGIVPSAYTKDSWNESLTQYIDSIVYLNNADRSLEAGLRTVNLKVPLTNMPVAHAYGSATYYRGTLVMRMLEDEITREKVLEGLRAIVKDRVGKDTSWPDLLPYFEKASGQKLDWFWKQWVSNAQFPTLKVVSSDTVQIERKFKTRVTVTQSGTPDPFRLRFIVRVRRGPQTADQLVSMRAPGETFTIESAFQPTSVEIDPLPHALVSVLKAQ